MGLFDAIGGALGSVLGPIGGAIGSIGGALGNVLTQPGANGGRQLSPLGQIGANLGLGIGSSAIGGLLGRQSSTPLENAILQQELAAGRTGLQAGQNLLGMGTGALQGPLNYYNSILNGNRGQVASALGPQLSQIGQGYQTAANTSAALNPRGGPSAQFNAELPFQQQRDVTQLFQQARPQAAQALGGLGGQLISSGANSIYAATAAGRDILNQQENLRQLQARQGQSIGAGLFGQLQQSGLLGQLGKTWGGLGGGGGGGTSTVKNLPGSISTGDVSFPGGGGGIFSGNVGGGIFT
jgi:hypothetical protein